MKAISIKPFDTLFFRDGRPFGMGEESFAQFIFPPFPTTFYGALRSKIISENATIDEFKDGKIPNLKIVAGTPDKKGSLRIIGPLLRKEGEFIFPLPADVFEGEDEKALKKLPWENVDIIPWLGNKKERISHLIINREEETFDAAKSYYVKHKALKEYLKGEREEFTIKKEGGIGDVISDKEVYRPEPKIGIALEAATKTAKENYLYRLSMIRLCSDVDFVLFFDGVSGVNFPTKGILQVGGEGRAAYYEEEQIENPGLSPEEFIKALKGKKFLKVYLLTPAFVGENGLPYIENLERHGLKLVGYAVKGIVRIGGWDMHRRFPKPMRPAWAAGSLLLFEIPEGSSSFSPEDFYEDLNFKPVLCKVEGNELSDEEKEGYGVVLLGVEDAH